MSEITMQSPVDVGPLSASDGSVTLADAYATTKVQVRAGAGTAAAAALGVSYGSSTRNVGGDLVCGTRPDEWTIYGDPGRSGAIAASVPTEGFVTVIDITHGTFIERELALIKVQSETATRSEIIQITEVFRASIVDVSTHSMTIEATGKVDKINAMIAMLSQYGITEMARTGNVALLRDSQPKPDNAE